MKRNSLLWVAVGVVVVATLVVIGKQQRPEAPAPGVSVSASPSTSPARSAVPRATTPAPASATPTVSATPTPAPAVVGFSSATYTAVEGGNAVTITITLTGNLSGIVGVDYRSSSDTATAKDYTGVSGSVHLGPGNTEYTFTIQAFQDTDVEDETIDLTLSGLEGDAVFGHATATLTVDDDDGPQN